MDIAGPVLLDACVLAPISVCDILLRLAEDPSLYVPCWSEDILAEVRRTQIGKLDWPATLADYWREQVTASFPDAIGTDYEPLIAQCSNHEEDRHVLAAAVRAQSSAIITFNLKHFPVSALMPHGIVAIHPSDYLISLYSTDPDAIMARIDGIASTRAINRLESLRRLRIALPEFAEHVAVEQGWVL